MRLTAETHTFDMSYCGQERVYASTTETRKNTHNNDYDVLALTVAQYR